MYVEDGDKVADEVQGIDDDGNDTDDTCHREGAWNEKDDKAHKENTKSKMEEDGKDANDGDDMPFPHASETELSNETAVANGPRCLDHVLTEPLLSENSEKCRRQAQRQAGEPESIDP